MKTSEASEERETLDASEPTLKDDERQMFRRSEADRAGEVGCSPVIPEQCYTSKQQDNYC